MTKLFDSADLPSILASINGERLHAVSRLPTMPGLSVTVTKLHGTLTPSEHTQ